MRRVNRAVLIGLSVLFFAVLVQALECRAAQPPAVQPLTTAEMIRPSQIIGDGDFKGQTRRCAWYRSRLGPYASAINAAALETGIPPQLLSAVVLNELADVGMEDVAQDQQLASTHGDFRLTLDAINRPVLSYKPIGEQSFGIAQINPRTALKYNAVPIVGQEKLSRDYVEYQVAYRLLNRLTAIQAAARVIRGILNDLEFRFQDSPWASQLMLRDRRFSANDPYNGVNPPASTAKRTSDRGKEVTLAYLVTSIYNTGTIVEAVPKDTPRAHDLDNPKGFPNALNHASTVRVIALDLFETGGCGMGLISFDEIRKQRGWIGTGPPPGIPYPPALQGPKCSDKAAAYHAECDRIFKHCTATHCKVVFSDCYNQCGSCGAGQINETIADKWCQLDPSYLPAAQSALNDYVGATRQCVNLFVNGQLKEPFFNDQKIGFCLEPHKKRLEERRKKAIENACAARCTREGRRGVLHMPLKCMCE